MIDETDRRILEILQRNGRASNAAIARDVDMAPSAVLERIRKLEGRGVIRGYTAQIDPCALGQGLLAFVFVRTEERAGVVVAGEALSAIPEVQEVHHVAGEDCYLIKVRTASPSALSRLLRERLGAIPTVGSTRSTIVLETIREGSAVPIGERSAEETGDD